MSRPLLIATFVIPALLAVIMYLPTPDALGGGGPRLLWNCGDGSGATAGTADLQLTFEPR